MGSLTVDVMAGETGRAIQERPYAPVRNFDPTDPRCGLPVTFGALSASGRATREPLVTDPLDARARQAPRRA